MNNFVRMQKLMLAFAMCFFLGTYSSQAQNMPVTGDTICAPGSGTLTASPQNGGFVRWFEDLGLTALGDGNVFNTPVVAETTEFLALELDPVDSTTVLDGALVALVVNQPPNPPTVTTDEFQCAGPGNLSAIISDEQAGNDLYITVYDDEFGTTPIFQDTVPGVGFGTVTFVTPDIPAGLHLFEVYLEDPNTGCQSDYVSLVLTYVDAPGAPTVTGDTDICEGESTTLTAAGTGGDITWYSDAGLTTVISTGSQYNTGALAATTDYWVTESSDQATDCESAATLVTITVNSRPTTPIVDGDSICAGESATLTAITAFGPPQWYSDAAGTNLVSTSTTYITDPLSQTTTFYVQEDDGTCTSALVPVTAVVTPATAQPNIDAQTSLCHDEDFFGSIIVGSSAVGGTWFAWVTDAVTGDTIASGSDPINGLVTEVDFPGFLFVPGTYNFIWTIDDGSGCLSEPLISQLVVNEIPEAPLMVDTVEICFGETATLFAFGDFDSTSYVTWYDEPAFDPLAFGWEYETQPLVATQTFYASVTNEAGCEGPLSATVVVVNPNPANPTVTGDTVCAGETATLSVAGAGGTYTWSTDGAGNNVVATGTSYITQALAQTTTFFVTETDANGCSSATVPVTAYVRPAPQAPQAGDITLCVDEAGEITATGSGSGTLIWYNGSYVELEQDAMPPATGSLSVGPFATEGTYFFYVSEFDGQCESELTEIEVVVGGEPAPPVAIGDTICAGESATLFAIGSGGMISWYSDLALTNLVGVGPSYTTQPLFANTSFWVTERYGSCESSATEVEVVVQPQPATPTASSNAPICEGETLELYGQLLFGVTYEWSGPNGFSSNQQNPTIPNVSEADHQGIYTLVVTNNATGCSSEPAVVNVDIYPTPEAPSLTSNSPICAGEDVVLTAGVVDGGLYTFYDENDDVIVADTTSNTITVENVTSSTTFGVSVSVNGCESAITTTGVTVYPNPAAVAVSSNSPVCERDAIILIATAVPGATYVWTGPNGPLPNSGAVVNIPNADLDDAGTYTVYVIVNGCRSEDSSTDVVVNPAPVLPQNPTSNSPVCEHDTLFLIAPDLDGVTYQWTGPNGFSSNEQSPIIYDVIEEDHQGFYTLVVTDEVTGCTSVNYTLLVLVNKFPDNVSADNNGPICQGEDLTLTVTSIFGAEYVWTGPFNFYAETNDPFVTIENAQPWMTGTYEVTIILGDCASMTVSTEAIVYENPIADAGEDLTIEEGTIFQLDGLGSVGAVDYFWTGENQNYFDDPTRPNPIIGLNGPLPARDDPYVFVLTVWNEHGCTDVDTMLVFVYETQNLVIPNIITPNGDGVNDTWVVTYLDNLDNYTLSIYARGGTLILQTDNYANDWGGTMDGDDLPEGTYWYTIRHDGEDVYKGFIEILR